MRLSQSAFGEACGVGKNSQINYESDKRSPDSTYLMAAAALGADVQFILTGERGPVSLPGMMLQSMSQTLANPTEFLQVPVFDVALAAGAGLHNYTEDVIAHLAFRKDWLKGIGVAPASAVVARAHGTSMLPTIHDGDMVLIDDSQASPPMQPRAAKDQRPAKIFALHNGEGARIKRLELAAPGTLALLSDNPDCPPEFHPATSVSIIGRVMWWGHTNRE